MKNMSLLCFIDLYVCLRSYHLLIYKNVGFINESLTGCYSSPFQNAFPLFQVEIVHLMPLTHYHCLLEVFRSIFYTCVKFVHKSMYSHKLKFVNIK